MVPSWAPGLRAILLLRLARDSCRAWGSESSVDFRGRTVGTVEALFKAAMDNVDLILLESAYMVLVA